MPTILISMIMHDNIDNNILESCICFQDNVLINGCKVDRVKLQSAKLQTDVGYNLMAVFLH